MFQFPSFPSYSYVLAVGWQRFALPGFPIRISTDQSLFATPRSFSQLITSFIGSRCQGIHSTLLVAWPICKFKICGQFMLSHEMCLVKIKVNFNFTKNVLSHFWLYTFSSIYRLNCRFYTVTSLNFNFKKTNVLTLSFWRKLYLYNLQIYNCCSICFSKCNIINTFMLMDYYEVIFYLSLSFLATCIILHYLVH